MSTNRDIIDLVTNTNNIAITENYSYDQNGEEMNILQKICDINQPLTQIFPFLKSLNGLCVQLYNFSLDKDSLNLGECKKIKSFQFTGNFITELPVYIKSFMFISDISFFLNKLNSSCFDIISELSTLESLNLEKNMIEKIPRTILKLINLKELRLSADMFDKVPEIISDIKLEKLYLTQLNPIIDEFNDIRRKETIGLKIIKGFLKINTLECLILRFNKIGTLKFYDENHNIKKLDFCGNNIYTLPDSIIKLKSLEYLNLQLNRLTTVPSILLKLESLKELNLRDNLIISYKDMCFYSLDILHVSLNIKCEEFIIKFISSPLKDFRIYQGPYYCMIFSEICRMVYLKSLYLYEGFIIYKIIENIEMLENLELLYIASIRVCCIHDSIFKLKKIKSLHLKLHDRENNGFSKRLFYKLQMLKNLEELSLKDIKKKSMLYDKIFDLKNLKKLELSGFFMENIEGFSRLINLKYLSIENTNFNKSRNGVKLYLQRYNRKVQYKSCMYDNNTLEDKNYT